MRPSVASRLPILIFLATTFAPLVTACSGNDNSISLEGVPDSELSARGIRLWRPEGGAAIPAEQAIDIGMRDRVSDNIREPILVRLVSAADGIDGLAWAIVFDTEPPRRPISVPGNPDPTPSPTPSPPNCGPTVPYVVAFVDARTGDKLFEFEAERTSDLAPGETCPPTTIPLTPTLWPIDEPPLKLQGISGDALGTDIYLAEPHAEDTALVSQSEAIEIALQKRPGASTFESVLGRLTQLRTGSDVLVWAVNLDPATVIAEEPLGGGFCRSDSFSPEYSVVFVDALTGDVVLTAERSLLPPTPDGDGKCP